MNSSNRASSLSFYRVSSSSQSLQRFKRVSRGDKGKRSPSSSLNEKDVNVTQMTTPNSNLQRFNLPLNQHSVASNVYLHRIKSSTIQKETVELKENDHSLSQILSKQEEYDPAQYNIFSDSSNMRRMALLGSSNKKKAEKVKYKSQAPNSPLLKSLDPLSDSQLKDLEKKHRVFKAGKTMSSNSENKDEYDEIIQASSNHSRSISNGKVTPKVQYLQNQASALFIGTDSTITPTTFEQSKVLPIGQNSSGLFNMQYIQASLSNEDLSSKANNSQRTVKAKVAFSPNKGQEILIHQNQYSNKKESQTNNFLISQKAISTIRSKMRELAKELAENEEIGLDENTLLRIFENRADQYDSITDQLKFAEQSIGNQQQLNQKTEILQHPTQSSSFRVPQTHFRTYNGVGQSILNEFLINQDPQLSGGLLGSPEMINSSQSFYGPQQNLGALLQSSGQRHSFNQEFKETFAQKDLNLCNSFYNDSRPGDQSYNHAQNFSLNEIRRDQLPYEVHHEGNSTVIINNQDDSYPGIESKDFYDQSSHYQDALQNQYFQQQYMSLRNSRSQQKNKQTTSKKQKSNSKSSSKVRSKSKSSCKKSQPQPSNKMSNGKSSQQHSKKKIRKISPDISEFDQLGRESTQINIVQIPQEQKEYVSLSDNCISNSVYAIMPQQERSQSKLQFQKSDKNLTEIHEPDLQVKIPLYQVANESRVPPSVIFQGASTPGFQAHSRCQSALQKEKSASRRSKSNLSKQSISTSQQAQQSRAANLDQKSTSCTRTNRSLLGSKLTQSNLTLKNSQSQMTVKCNCIQSLRVAKDALKKAMKVKYDQKIKDLKRECEQKFKHNEKVWKKRLDHHKQLLKAEKEQSANYVKTIQEMQKRVLAIEKKNQLLHELIKQQKAESIPRITQNQKLQTASDYFSQQQQVYSPVQSKQVVSQCLPSLRRDEFVENAFAKADRKRATSGSSMSSADTNQENSTHVANSLRNDQEKMKRIESILYAKKK